MSRLDKALREENPSFSSTLLDKIYRSIDEGDTNKRDDLRFYRETTIPKKENKASGFVKSAGRDFKEGQQQEEVSAFRRACLIEKWMDKKVSQKVNNNNNNNNDKNQQKRHNNNLSEFERRSHNSNDHDLDQDVMFFSSTSMSSDSSSGGFSSSDTDSMYGTRSKASSFCPPTRPKPVKTNASSHQSDKKKTERTLFYEQREFHFFDDYYHYNYASERNTPRQIEEGLIKSKSRALKIYSNLKKVKQPISPGGKLATFINSLFATSNAKKPKNPTLTRNCEEERKLKSGQESTCSSASSFSRSCLSKNSPSTRERLRNGVKRSVRFYPVSVIVDEDSRPCGHKSLYESEKEGLMPLSLPTAWKIGKSPTRKVEEDLMFQVMEKSKKVEEMAREFLKDYHQNQKKKKKNCCDVEELANDYDDEDDDDDAASYSSSDLFELDHLALIGNHHHHHNRYSQELPVYETTHVDTNRAIANGLIV